MGHRQLFASFEKARTLLLRAVLLVVISCPSSAALGFEVSLFDAGGNAVAYIAPSEDMTIYLWDGEPVAYLEMEKSNGPHVYGFNGKHLGWFAFGIIWDHSGGAACVTKDVLSSTNYEPYKGLKSLKPLRSLKELAPYKPSFSKAWSQIGCALLLASGDN
jgi:hypothetical protein